VDLSDEALLDQFRKSKDPSYFRALFRRYQNRVFNAAYRILGNTDEAEEVVQETYLKVHENLRKFRRESTFAAWLFRIAHNCCLDTLRAKQRKGNLFPWSFDPQSSSDGEEGDVMNTVTQLADTALTPAESAMMSEQGELVASSLRQLPATQRMVVVLHDIEGFSYQEISQIVGANIGTVRSRLHYGRQKLRELLEPYFTSQNVSPAPR
jgi:RNA polymerase sigma-70 factor (ECF subfamily)